MPDSIFTRLVEDQHAQKRIGVVSVCSANPHVLSALAQKAVQHGFPLLVESTCNQVNQFGGYTGMTPDAFQKFVKTITDHAGLPSHHLLFGGDHLGPEVWKNEYSDSAMVKAEELVKACVRAGYTKIHLDASMKCADDDPTQPLSPRLSAQRAAQLCFAAEEAAAEIGLNPVYVIGTEVPIPGGAHQSDEGVHITLPDDAIATIEITQEEFMRLGLDAAWERVFALVVQPGVEFADKIVYPYNHKKAADLSAILKEYKNLIFEAHSTDYQSAEALRSMVSDHFAVLKVGPALTFALREGFVALEAIEKEWLGKKEITVLSGLTKALETAMLENPTYWQSHYHGTPSEQALARMNSFSDRVRYYWPQPAVQQALQTLIKNLTSDLLPLELIERYLPNQYKKVSQKSLETAPLTLVYEKVWEMAEPYYAAVTPDKTGGEKPLVKVHEAYGPLAGEMIKVFLEAHDIPCMVSQESLGVSYAIQGMDFSLASAWIMTTEENALEARLLLDALERGDFTLDETNE
ncbi:MAG TPA: class II D-tagatose-bisphosphate aldolase, non-catalytic subunit [Longilinea sp.]|nr:class II D-tagatose-bisphosphate aldolase, non-catalytic subunit [Longilinea sp.]